MFLHIEVAAKNKSIPLSLCLYHRKTRLYFRSSKKTTLKLKLLLISKQLREFRHQTYLVPRVRSSLRFHQRNRLIIEEKPLFKKNTSRPEEVERQTQAELCLKKQEIQLQSMESQQELDVAAHTSRQKIRLSNYRRKPKAEYLGKFFEHL